MIDFNNFEWGSYLSEEGKTSIQNEINKTW